MIPAGPLQPIVALVAHGATAYCRVSSSYDAVRAKLGQTVITQPIAMGSATATLAAGPANAACRQSSLSDLRRCAQ